MTTQAIQDALISIRNWLDNEREEEQVAVADKALLASGVKAVPCFQCDGRGSWEVEDTYQRRDAITPATHTETCVHCDGAGKVSI